MVTPREEAIVRPADEVLAGEVLVHEVVVEEGVCWTDTEEVEAEPEPVKKKGKMMQPSVKIAPPHPPLAQLPLLRKKQLQAAHEASVKSNAKASSAGPPRIAQVEAPSLAKATTPKSGASVLRSIFYLLTVASFVYWR